MFGSLRRRLGGLGSSSHSQDNSNGKSDGSEGGRRNSASSGASTWEERQVREWLQRVPQLANFDACVAAADALAGAAPIPQEASNDHHVTTSRSSSLTRLHRDSGLVHTEVLISPDGNLLLIPPGIDPDQPFSKYLFAEPKHPSSSAPSKNTTDTIPEEDAVPTSEIVTTTETTKTSEDSHGIVPSQSEEPTNADDDDNKSQESTDSIFSELLWNSKDDYESAIFLGNDLNPAGDQSLNGFSAKGWATKATTFAMRQTKVSLENLAEFCQAVIVSRKEAAVQTHQACDTLRSQLPQMGGHNPSGTTPPKGDDEWELVFDPKSDFAPTSRRSGPLLGTSSSSLSRALVLLEDYFSASAEAESAAWRQATVQQVAILPQLQTAVEHFNTRLTAREDALEESSKRARLLEDRMRKLKQERDKKWENVYKAEEKITRRMEALRKERARQREKARLTKMQQQAGASPEPSNNEQVWDVVNAISDMDSTSFEPMQLSSELQETKTIKNAAAMMTRDNSERNMSVPADNASDPLPISRESMEDEVGLPQLRATAMASEDAIDECAKHLLTLLGNLDMTRRSARVAAETAMLAAANAQAKTLKELVRLERMAIQERLKHLSQVEEMMALHDIDVREDLQEYIKSDKRDVGGQSHLGDDDDGGTAAALSILSNHVDQEDGDDNGGGDALASLADIGIYSSSSENDDEDSFSGGSDASKSVSRDAIQNAISQFFFEGEGFQSSEEGQSNADDDISKIMFEKLDSAIALLCDVAKEKTTHARRLRSTMCYTLNSKRSGNAEVASKVQFDGLVKVFDAILSSCAEDDDEKGLAHAKMLIMLSQTFYLQLQGIEEQDSLTNDGPLPSEVLSQLKERGFVSSSDDTTIALAKGDVRLKMRADGYAALASADAVVAEGRFTSTVNGIFRFTWERALKFDDGEVWKEVDPSPLINTLSLLDESISCVEKGEKPETLWGAGKPKPNDALIGNGFLMRSVSFLSSNELDQREQALTPTQKKRNRRLYVKSRLTNHAIWSKDEFWDIALTQQISESLAQSGVMANFDRSTSRGPRAGGNEHGYRKVHKMKWHDLSAQERVSAASQVHAVVFAQLGALAHSMLEFGCGLQRACAFVRRMSIKHQLPSSQRTMLLQHLVAGHADTKTGS